MRITFQYSNVKKGNIEEISLIHLFGCLWCASVRMCISLCYVSGGCLHCYSFQSASIREAIKKIEMLLIFFLSTSTEHKICWGSERADAGARTHRTHTQQYRDNDNSGTEEDDKKRNKNRKRKEQCTTTAVAGSYSTIKWCYVYKNEIFDFLI